MADAGEPDFSGIDLHKPKWSQETYTGRAKHFFTVTNPLNILLSDQELENAKQLVLKHRSGEKLPSGTTLETLWDAKYKYDSAYHPDTNEKMLLIGRMSAQVPMNMTITGLMMTFYKSPQAVIFWQWNNQTFNAIVNYTNRSGDAPLSNKQIGTSYICATTGAVTTALLLNSLTKKLPSLVGRFVPFAAVAAANCINIPMMRSSEITKGIPVVDEHGNRLCESKAAAKKAIGQVTMSRICMAVPGMVLPPIVMNKLSKGKFLTKYPFMNAPIQIAMVGVCLVFATPLCCALFPQKSSIGVSHLEEDARAKVVQQNPGIDTVYFNKGL